MTNPAFSTQSQPAKMQDAPGVDALVSTSLAQPTSTGMGLDMVRGVALAVMAAVMAVLVLLTQRWLLAPTGVGAVLGWLVLWSVLLAALLMLSRLSVWASHAALSWLDKSAFERAQARSRARQRLVSH